jgi:hypothetical protein
MLDSPLMWKRLIPRLFLLYVIRLHSRGWSVRSGGPPCEETSRRISTLRLLFSYQTARLVYERGIAPMATS